MATLKLHYHNFDEGDFTDDQIVDYVSFIALFDKESNDITYTKYSWTVKNNYLQYFLNINQIHFMVIAHMGKDVYDIYYCDQSDKYANGNTFYYHSIRELSKMFFDNDFSALKTRLGKAEMKAIKLINSFTQLDFEYTYTNKLNVYLIIGSILPLVSIIILYSVINIVSIIASLGPMLTFIFLVKLHINHLNESKNKTITISSRKEEIKITENGNEIKFLKSDIKKLIIVKISTTYRNPFAGYEYSQIILNNNSIINVSNLLMESHILKKKIGEVEIETKYIPVAYMRQKTNIIDESFQ